MNLRSIAARALDQIVHRGRSLDSVLASELASIKEHRDAAFVQEIVYGTTRWYWQLRPQLHELMNRPLRAKDSDIESLLLVGLYQIRHLKTAPHAAVAETVSACKGLKKPWAKGLINATLRNALRNGAQLDKCADGEVSIKTAHPAWMTASIRADWPDHWQQILHANNTRAPLTLRVNQARTERSVYLTRLQDKDIPAHSTTFATKAVRIESPVPVEQLPGFSEGDVSVQDEAAQLACEVMDLKAGDKVLDACAAPGGKTAHMLETFYGELRMTALDHSGARVERLQETLTRLGLPASVLAADATALESWWDGEPFDRVLIDAPCSGSGVIRRHPDIKLHRREDDIEQFATTQRRLLDTLWRVVKPGGKLVYATCSVLRAENDHVIAALLTEQNDASPDSFPAPWGIATQFGAQIITGENDMDGFYYARLSKAANS